MKKNVFLGVMIMLGVWCLVYVGVKIDMWRLGYAIEDLETQRAALKKQQEGLQVRLSELTDPQRVAQRAQSQLGFIVPQEGQIVMVSLDTLPHSESGGNSPVRLVREFSETVLSIP
ncbi:MAG: septum formation initiator family protein [Nitrospirota bacterium]|jgi:cell division protein FtsL|nr:septum formation initiator family protein [Nitrospirota bacterium]MDH4360881.1 septum formation initiator family protein [Nitrospirota bacterium]MDH5295497.1 septum formation initiator family protein [Nitrospirota bacterium]MDH5574911.1 septum formation initiator family protein [Nitrospirota bacterium]